jgi:LPXTG-site transpeptidase (sortase) family protein
VSVLLALGVPFAAVTLGDRSDRPAAATALPVSTTTEPVQTPTQPEAFEVAPGVEISSASPAPRPPVAPGLPLRLVVPSLDVNAPVVPITAPGGVLLPPSDPQTLGWWRDGAQPGAARGGALITGHTVHTGGGAFDDLETLRKGDEVGVRTARGLLRYAVTEVTVYRKATLARDAARVFSQSVPGRLVLITCEDWNGSGYDSNAVVFADRV